MRIHGRSCARLSRNGGQRFAAERWFSQWDTRLADVQPGLADVDSAWSVPKAVVGSEFYGPSMDYRRPAGGDYAQNYRPVISSNMNITI
jgi:hypothetical protein